MKSPRLACLSRAVALLAIAPLAGAQPGASVAADQVIITATRLPQALSTVLADVSVLDRSDIERAGVVGVAELLARLPGIELSRSGGLASATGVFVRGNEARHTAVYLDGVRLDSQSTGGALWEQVPLDRLERIEVLRGPAAAIYGSDAVAGVVQLFTRRGSGPARASAALMLGSDHTVQGEAAVSGSAGALDYALSASQGRSDGFDATRAGTFGHNPDRDGWKRRSAQAQAGLALGTVHRLEASWLGSRLQSGYDGSATTDDRNHYRLDTGRLAWQARWNAQATTRLQASQSRSTFESQPSFYRTETTLRDLVLLHEQRVAGQHLSATLERREDELANAATAFGAALAGRRHQNALGLGWRTDIGAHGLQAHVRHDDDSEFGARRTGSLAWGWAFRPGWRLSASAASSFRVPTLYQRFSQYGSANLVPESGRNLEAGLRWDASGREANLSVWRNRLSNLIGFGAPGPCADTFGCYVNVGRAQVQGITLAGRATVGAFALHGSVGWHDAVSRDTGKQLPRRAKRLASAGVETVVDGWTLGAELQAAGTRFENAANTQRLAGYGLLNLSARRSLGQGWTLDARLDNVGDRVYELARGYPSTGLSAQVALRWSM